MKFRQALASYEIDVSGSKARHPIADHLLFTSSWKTGEEICEVNPLALEMEQSLENHGLTYFEPLAHGSSSVVVASGDKVVRVATSLPYRAPSDMMAQPLKTGTVGPFETYSWEILTRLDTQSITNMDVLEAAIRLKNEGYLLRDPGRDNLGRRKKDGALMVLDPGGMEKASPDRLEAEFPALVKWIQTNLNISDEDAAQVFAKVDQPAASANRTIPPQLAMTAQR